MIDVRTAIFERAELFWEPALLTRERVDRSTIPIGWHCYELEARHAYDYGRPVCLWEKVGENFVGTVLTPKKVSFHRRKDYRCVYGNVVGFDLYYTIGQFCGKIGLPAPIFL